MKKLNIKNKKIGYSVLILLVIFSANIINFITTEFQTVFSLKMQNTDFYEADYSYSSFNVSQLTFMFEYSDENGVIEDVLGTYELDNSFNIHKLNIFNLLNQIAGKKHDDGRIKLTLKLSENCVYLDCLSNNNKSTPVTISKINLQEDVSFLYYKFNFGAEQKSMFDKKYTLLEGINSIDGSKIQVYLLYEN